MENLRITLIILAILAILALLIGGFRANKKEKKNLFKEYNSENQDEVSNDEDELDHNMQAYFEPNQVAYEPTSTKSSSTLDSNALNNEAIFVEVESESKDQNEINFISPELEQITLDEMISSTEPKEPLTLQIYVTSSTKVEGEQLLRFLSKNNLVYDSINRFFVLRDPVTQKVLYSVCNMNETGTFENIDRSFMTSGIVLFMQVTSCHDEHQLKLMSELANKVSTVFDATILDQDLKPFDLNSYLAYQGKIEAYV